MVASADILSAVEKDRLIPLVEAARQIGVSPMTLRRHIKAKNIEYEKPGRDYLIPESALMAFASTRPRPPGRPRRAKP